MPSKPRGAGFYRWPGPEPGTIRLVASFNTDAFIAALRRCLAAARM